MPGPRISGRNAVTWPAFWAVLVASVLVSLPDHYATWTPATAWRNLLCIALAVVVMFGVMVALRAVVLGDSTAPLAGWRVLGIFVAGAVVRALMLAALLPTIGAGEGRPLYRIVSSLLIMVPVLVVMAGVVDLVRTSAARRAALEAEADVLRGQAQDARARTAELQEGATARVRALLLGRLEALRDRGATGIGADLRRDVEQVIRPMSHRMAAEDAVSRAPVDVPLRTRIPWSQVWPAASLGRPFRPVAIAVIVGLASLNALGNSTDVPLVWLGYVVVQGLVVCGAVAVVGQVLTPRMRRMPTGPRTAMLVLGAVVAMVAAGLVLGLVIATTGGAFAWRVPIAMVLLAPFVICALAVGQGFRQQVAASEADLTATNQRLQEDAALAASVLWHEERRLSRALHGPIQAAVSAAAMRIEAGDEAGAESLLVDAVGHLDLDAQEQRRVVDALADVAAAWDGLCQVRVHLAPDVAARLDGSASSAASFIDICTEACSNAVRHGGAEHVVVRAACQGDALELVVSDDGAPVGTESPGGLGTALLDDVTLDWARQREGDATVLRASLPLPAS